MLTPYLTTGMYVPHNGKTAILFVHKCKASNPESALMEACSYNQKGQSHNVNVNDLNVPALVLSRKNV